VAGVGVLLVVLGSVPALVVPGIVLWGLGASLGFPVGMSAAADDPAKVRKTRHHCPNVVFHKQSTAIFPANRHPAVQQGRQKSLRLICEEVPTGGGGDPATLPSSPLPVATP
jgi:hypothetical protein